MELSDRILGSLYKPEVIHTKAVERIDTKKVKVTYVFPPYQRTLKDMGHVGMSQMNEGLVEGLYCAIGYAIEHGDIQTTADIESYIRSMAKALFIRQDISFRTMLKAGDRAELFIEVAEVREAMRGKFHSVVSKITGFMRGEVECWLPKE